LHFYCTIIVFILSSREAARYIKSVYHHHQASKYLKMRLLLGALNFSKIAHVILNYKQEDTFLPNGHKNDNFSVTNTIHRGRVGGLEASDPIN
jgi:hypothetical protein